MQPGSIFFTSLVALFAELSFSAVVMTHSEHAELEHGVLVRAEISCCGHCRLWRDHVRMDSSPRAYFETSTWHGKISKWWSVRPPRLP